MSRGVCVRWHRSEVVGIIISKFVVGVFRSPRIHELYTPSPIIIGDGVCGSWILWTCQERVEIFQERTGDPFVSVRTVRCSESIDVESG